MRRARRTTPGGVLAVALLLAGCGDPAPRNPRDVAVDACERQVVHEYDTPSRYDLPGAGGATEVQRLDTAADVGFEVIGAHGDTAWICTWESTSTAAGTRTETRIDRR